MLQKFDSFNRHEIPNIRLCNPNKHQIGILNGCYNMELSLRFNEMSEFTFTVPQRINGQFYPYYNKILSKKLILIDGIGYFIINTVTESSDGIKTEKQVVCYSLEAELNFKKVNLFSGTYKFYDLFNPQETLLYAVIQNLPNWSVGYVDVDLMLKYRTFDIPDSTVYNFLMNDVENSYECVFIFDTFNRTINAYSLSSLTKKTDIYLSFENLLNTVNIEEMSDEIVTALNVYGGGDLSIHTVNPLGSATIYNFDYYKNTDWMSQGLINALANWENLIKSNQSRYSNLLVQLSEYNSDLIILQSELVELKSEYDALEGVQKARIEQGLSISSINSQMRTKQNQINTKKTQIASKENSIKSTTSNLKSINDILKFSNNFTQQQYNELNTFMIENTYQNDSFIQTSIMTPVEIQQMSQELYNQGVNILSRVSQPRFTFSVDSVNFLYLKEFQKFINQLELGCILNVRMPQENLIAKPILLEMKYSFDNPELFELTFGNRYRLDDSAYVFSDLFSDAINAGTSVNFDGVKWGEWVNSGSSNAVTEFINSALDTSKNNLINADNQEILINQNGLKGRTYEASTDSYDPKQVWLTSNTLAFTKDNWQTASLALGEISYNNQRLYGVVGDVIVGKIVAGNNLQISNNNNNFILDENGAVLTNASFSLITENKKTQIILNPKDGIKIQSRTSVGNPWVDKMYVDNNGNAVFSGKISANEGTIGGWDITHNGLEDDRGNYIHSDGTAKIGILTITKNSGTFRGNIFAENLDDYGIKSIKIGSSAVTTSKINDEAVTESKLNKVFINKLNANFANINTLVAQKASIAELNALKASIPSLVTQTISGYNNHDLTLRSDNLHLIATKNSIEFQGMEMIMNTEKLALYANNTGTGYGAILCGGLTCTGLSCTGWTSFDGKRSGEGFYVNNSEVLIYSQARMEFRASNLSIGYSTSGSASRIYFWGHELYQEEVKTQDGGSAIAICRR